jgi:hypothetical protein
MSKPLKAKKRINLVAGFAGLSTLPSLAAVF